MPDSVLAEAAAAAGGATTERISGADRYATAAEVSQRFFEAGSTDRVYLASGTTLRRTRSPAARPRRPTTRPLLLTAPGALPGATLDELRRLGVRDVVLLGGPRAVSTAVQDALVREGFTVRRVSGADRYETSQAVVDEAFGGQRPAAFLATGTAFADALAAGPFAAPVVLTPPDRVDPASRAALAQVDPELAVVLGGQAAVRDDVARTLTADVG